MATVRDLIESLKLLDPSKEVGRVSYYLDKIQECNLGDFVNDAEVLARLLDGLVKPDVAYGEGSFCATGGNFITFDDGEGGYDFYCEIKIDNENQCFLVETLISGVNDESARFSTIEEVADFLCEEWGC